jgi:hypothetical protein
MLKYAAPSHRANHPQQEMLPLTGTPAKKAEKIAANKAKGITEAQLAGNSE